MSFNEKRNHLTELYLALVLARTVDVLLAHAIDVQVHRVGVQDGTVRGLEQE